MTPKRPTKNALVLSGGGAKGAYEVGVIKALVNGRSPATGCEPLSVEILTGTSVGAYNAAFLASRGAATAADSLASLERIWRRRIAGTAARCGNGVFRLRGGGPLDLLDPGCWQRPLERLAEGASDLDFFARYFATRAASFLGSMAPIPNRLLSTVDLSALFSPEPLYELIRETIDPSSLRHSDKELTIAATNWRDGTVRLFSKEDLTDRVGPEGIEASTAIPGIFPPVEIEGVPHVDGGVLLNTPIRPAIRAGAEVLHVIYLDPEVADIPLPDAPNTLDTVYRLYLVMQAAKVRADIELAGSIQREMDLHRRLGILDRDYVTRLRPDAGANSRVLRRLEAGRPYRPLTIHRYRPRTDLGGGEGLLEFRSGFIDELIGMGHRDAVEHDCQKSECVVPEEGRR